MHSPLPRPPLPQQASAARGSANTLILYLCLLLSLNLSGCAQWINNASNRFSHNLSQAILNQNDLETVRAGAPAYLLLIEGLLQDNPDSEALLSSASDLYGTYSSLFVTDHSRALRLSEKALNYGLRALCQRHQPACSYRNGMDFNAFKLDLANLDSGALPSLYTLGAAWAGWIQVRSDDWNALAELPRIQALMTRVQELDEGYRQGSAHLYLGVLGTLVPSGLGGNPDQGRHHFQRAVELSEGRNLMAKVLFARHYGRLVFDRNLHDRLLEEVLETPAETEGLTLINTLAQQQARQLLEESDDYF